MQKIGRFWVCLLIRFFDSSVVNMISLARVMLHNMMINLLGRAPWSDNIMFTRASAVELQRFFTHRRLLRIEYLIPSLPGIISSYCVHILLSSSSKKNPGSSSCPINKCIIFNFPKLWSCQNLRKKSVQWNKTMRSSRILHWGKLLFPCNFRISNTIIRQQVKQPKCYSCYHSHIGEANDCRRQQ